MQVFSVTFAVLAVALCCHAKQRFEPAVAFFCGKGAMHMESSDEWVSDPTTDCIKDKEEILSYCSKVYPKLDITNIVESMKYKHIRGWCPLDKKCEASQTEAHKVVYYRCLTGPFQSDALIVPKGCNFKHIRDADKCEGFDYWKNAAQKSCKDSMMYLESHAMLLPCGTDVFTGVEYVCCDSEQSAKSKPDSDSLHPTQTSKVNEVAPHLEVKVDGKDKSKKSDDDSFVDKYFEMKSEAYITDEHAAFKKAKAELLKTSRDKTTKAETLAVLPPAASQLLLKQWSADKQKVEELKDTQPKISERLAKDVSAKYQKEYFALQADADSRLIQLDSTHQQHIQTALNTKKRKAAERLLEALQAKPANQHEVAKYLKRYISIENKDAQHCVQHYVKIRDRDSGAASGMISSTIEHLSLISTRITQSMDLLSTLNDEQMAEDIEDDVKLWMSRNLINVDSLITKLKTSEVAQVVKSLKETTTVAVPKKEEAKPTEELEKTPEITIIIEDDKKMDTPKEDPIVYKKYADKLAKTDFVKKPSDKKETGVVISAPNVEIVKGQKQPMPDPKWSHLAQGEALSLEANSMKSGVAAVNSAGSSAVGTILAVSLGVIGGLFIVTVVALVIKNKKVGRAAEKPRSNNYLEVAVNDSTTAEERHIASMQSGYENPTYKFLERRVESEA